MSACNLDSIKKVELRKAWKHEALDFTNWLAEEENLRLLSDEIGINIKMEIDGLVDTVGLWEQYFEWMKLNAEEFQSVFGIRLKMFKG